MLRIISKLPWISVLLSAAALSASAATTQTSQLTVTAVVTQTCTISAGTLHLPYDPVGDNATAPADSSFDIGVTCTKGATTTITLGQGSNADTSSTDAAPARRALKGTSDYLLYNLYSDSDRKNVWNNTDGVPYQGIGTADTQTVYARAASGQNIPAGSYSDTVLVTITF